MQLLLKETGTPSSFGMKFTKKSIRSGGISTDYAAHVEKCTILRLSNHYDETVLLGQCTDV